MIKVPTTKQGTYKEQQLPIRKGKTRTCSNTNTFSEGNCLKKREREYGKYIVIANTHIEVNSTNQD